MSSRRANRAALSAAAVATTALLLGACGGNSSSSGNDTGSTSPSLSQSQSTSSSPAESPTPTESSSAADAAAITIKDFAYSGADQVSAGATVMVTNNDGESHTLTADDGSFDVTVEPGKTASFTAPTKPGTYTYHCNFHSNMQGTLTVG